MKQTIFFLAIILGVQTVFGQIVPSSCIAPDSIVANYQDDADRLALRKIYFYNLTFKDSIKIPKVHSDTIMDALISVYNATTFPARDTVVNMYNIHSFPDRVMNYIQVAADSNLSWMQQLQNGITPTGNLTVDSLMSTYYLNIDNYNTYSGIFYWHIAVLKSDSNYNIPPMTLLFNPITGVFISEPVNTCCDGNNITSSIYSSYVELIYSVGWSDCSAGCIERRFWKFKVYYDCSVEYVGSYGSLLPLITGVNDIYKNSFFISPNPFNDIINISGTNKLYDYSITNIFGQELIKGKSINNKIENLSKLSSGIYIITVKTENQIATFKIVKE